PPPGDARRGLGRGDGGRVRLRAENGEEPDARDDRRGDHHRGQRELASHLRPRTPVVATPKPWKTILPHSLTPVPHCYSNRSEVQRAGHLTALWWEDGMDERELKTLLDEVKSGRLRRRGVGR